MNVSIEQLARALDLSAATVERWIRQGRIPIRRNGKDCIFSASSLEKWAREHHLPFALQGTAVASVNVEAPETLIAAMEHGGVHLGIKGDTVEAVLQSAVERFDFLQPEEKAELYRHLVEREALASTGIGRGVAIPHPRSPMKGGFEHPVIATCFLEKPVEYGAVDDQPVFVLFVLLNTDIQQHLRLLSRLSYCMRSDEFVRFLRTTPGLETLLNTIDEIEKRFDCADR